MKALGRDTYANKTMQGHVRFRGDGLSDKDREILDISQKSVEANKKRYIDDDFDKHDKIEKNFDHLKNYPERIRKVFPKPEAIRVPIIRG